MKPDPRSKHAARPLWRPRWEGAGADVGARHGNSHRRAALKAARPLWRVVDGSNWQPDDLRPVLAQVDAAVFQVGVPRFDEHVAQAVEMGKPVGSYIWCYPQRPVADELARCAELLAGWGAKLTVRNWVDVETTPGLVTPPADRVNGWLAGWYETRPDDGVYTSTGEWAEMTGNSRLFGAQPLWDAAYGVPEPGLPPGWGSWAGWQYTSTGQAGGVGNLDLSLMDPTRVLLATSPGDIVGRYGIFAGIVDTKTPPDAKGRIPWWGVDHSGNVYNWNGARPVVGLGGLRPAVQRGDVCAAAHVETGPWYPEGLVLGCDDGALDGAEWAASTFHLPVPAPAAHAQAPTGFRGVLPSARRKAAHDAGASA